MLDWKKRSHAVPIKTIVNKNPHVQYLPPLNDYSQNRSVDNTSVNVIQHVWEADNVKKNSVSMKFYKKISTELRRIKSACAKSFWWTTLKGN